MGPLVKQNWNVIMFELYLKIMHWNSSLQLDQIMLLISFYLIYPYTNVTQSVKSSLCLITQLKQVIIYIRQYGWELSVDRSVL